MTMQHERTGPKLLSLIVPVFNEEEALPAFLDAIGPSIRDVRRLLGPEGGVEIIFVDDGSRDGSAGIIRSMPRSDFAIQLVRLSRNFGKESALAAGLRHARGDAVVPMDVDLQDPPQLLPRMVQVWLGGRLVVNARRSSRWSDSLLKRTTSEIFYSVFNHLSDYTIEPNVGDFRLLDRRVVDIINSLTERVRFNKAIFSWVGFDPYTITYDRPARSAGSSKWNYWKLWNFALDGLTGSTTLPLRLWTYVGSFLVVLMMLFASFIVLRALVWGVDVPGYASLMVVMLLVGAVNLVAIGILGEYLGRISIEVRGRPSYLVSEHITLGEGRPTNPVPGAPPNPREGIEARNSDS